MWRVMSHTGEEGVLKRPVGQPRSMVSTWEGQEEGDGPLKQRFYIVQAAGLLSGERGLIYDNGFPTLGMRDGGATLGMRDGGATRLIGCITKDRAGDGMGP